MTDGLSLGNRMKEYEATTRTSLFRRTPVIIRIDGRAFHTFTKRIAPDNTLTPHCVVDESLLKTPFSIKLHRVMCLTTADLLSQIQNAVFAYTQSDEISILLRDWDNHETQQWFGATLQKIISVSASIATAAFNYNFHRTFGVEHSSHHMLATFDSRAFNLPKEEVANYFIWRQKDALRNSVQMYGRYFFSSKKMHRQCNEQVREMIVEAGYPAWETLPPWMRQGTAIYRSAHSSAGKTISDTILTDLQTPIFTEFREYIEQHLFLQQEKDINNEKELCI